MNLTEFKDWALAQGQVGNPGSGSYLGQCVSLVQQYLDKVFGIPYTPRGNAADWATNANVLSYFDKVCDLKPGDIIDYGADYGNGDGHIGIALGNGQILDQNGRTPLHVSTGAIYTSPSKYQAILRRKGAGAMTQSEAEKVVTYLYLLGTQNYPDPGQASYWVPRVKDVPTGLDELGKAMRDAQVPPSTTELKPGIYKVS